MSINEQNNFYLISLLFLIVPFSFRPNIGGLGLELPYNIYTWWFAISAICISLFYISRSQKLYWHKGFQYSLIFPVVIVFVGIFSDVPQPIVWFFRQLYILGGFVFLLMLLQLRFSNKQFETLIIVIIGSSFLHSLVGVIQIWQIHEFMGVLPFREDSVPIGIFQQPNTFATYLVTGLILSLYLISRPSFNHTVFAKKLFFIVSFGLSVYVVVSTGSRVGILSLVVGSLILIYSRKKELFRHKKILLQIVLVSCLATTAAHSGLGRAVDKTEMLTKGEFATIRQTMYAISLDLIKNKPFLGYGVGSFPKVWIEQTALFVAENPDAEVTQGTVSHPHNEILLWMIEGGLLSVLGLLVIAIVIIRALAKCGLSRGGAYAAILLPITLHTQVELPFYISSVHWFLWLFLVYMVFRHQSYGIDVKLSSAARYLILTSSIILFVISSLFLYHAGQGQKAITDFKFYGKADLSPALKSSYFNDYAEKISMQALLYNSISINDREYMPEFIEWAEARMKVNPEKGMFIMLTDAYGFVGDKLSQCRVAKKGISVFTKNERLLESVKNSCN